MSLFNKFGRQIEQFKQSVQTTAEGNADFQCRACDARVHSNRDQCPECGANEVESTTIEE